MRKTLLLFVCLFNYAFFAFGQDHHQDSSHDHSTTTQQDHAAQGQHGDHSSACGHSEGGHEFDPGATAFHHISDQNIYSIGPWHFPLPCFLYAKGQGWEVFSSGKFEGDSHGNGRKAYNRYVLFEGSVRRVVDERFPMGAVDLGDHAMMSIPETDSITGKKKDAIYVCYQDEKYRCESKSTADGGLFGGGVTSFYDFSITKNVASMLIVFALLAWMFLTVSKAYKKRDGQAPKGLQSFIEPIFLFIQDEVAKPFLGHKWEKFLPFLMSLFFFILGLNLFGQVPFFGGSNVTGNLGVTMVLALLTFLVTNINGNKHYWGHTLWMPGVPTPLKVLIMTPVEILGLFIKPLTLMLRLFANITAGHMVVVIFVGLIFVFGKAGANAGASYGTAVGSTLLTIFMMSIELLVAFIQAFVFTILTASYIGAATEEAHH